MFFAPKNLNFGQSLLVWLLVFLTSILAASADGTREFAINYETRWINQSLDHHNGQENSSFSQRYLISTDYWCGKNCPILFYCSGEFDIESYANSTGWMWENAQKLEAMIVFAEHRYYGESVPFDYKKNRNMTHLRIEQALLDYVTLIDTIKNKLYDAKHSPVVAIGGSYAGMLAYWMRTKHPTAVIGAIASSAPLLVFKENYDCNSLYDSMSKIYKDHSKICYENIRNFFIENAQVNYDIRSIFKTCSRSYSLTIEHMLRSILFNLAMYNYANPTNFVVNLPAHPVREFCSFLDKDYLSGIKLVERIADAFQIHTNYSGKLDCLKDVNQWEDTPKEWQHQKIFSSVCSNAKGIYPFSYESPSNSSQLDETKAFYGLGDSLKKSTNIIFSSGPLDPWSSSCVDSGNEANSIYAIEIMGAAHHEDLIFSGPNDSQGLKEARQLELNITNNWIYEYYASIEHLFNATNEENNRPIWLSRHNISETGLSKQECGFFRKLFGLCTIVLGN